MLPIKHVQTVRNDENRFLENTRELRSKISDNFFVSIKKSKNTLDDVKYTVKKMGILASVANKMFHVLHPEKEDNKKQTKITSKNTMNVIAGTAFLGAGITAVNAGKNLFQSLKSAILPSTKTKNENTDDLFGLKLKDKSILDKIKKSTKRSSDIFDRIIRIFSGGMIAGIPGLIFGFSFYKSSGIYKLLKDNIKKYSKELYGVFMKTVKHLFEWVKDNLIPTPIKTAAGFVKKIYTNLKSGASKFFKQIIRREKSNTTANNKKELKSVYSKGILGFAASIINRFTGNTVAGGSQSQSVKDNERRRNAVKNIGKNSVLKNKDENSDISVAEDGISTSLGKDPGNISIDKSIIEGSKVKQVAVYKAFRDAGFGHGQAMALTAEVGRENGYSAKVAFGAHNDPATGRNIGFISWQGSRKKELQKRLRAAGVLHRGGESMDRTYTSLLIMAKYVMWEMRNTHKHLSKVKKFLANPNISFEEAAPLLGGKGSFIGWARGQNTIKTRSGKRVAFDWRAQERRTKDYYKSLQKKLNGMGDDGEGFNANIKEDSETTKVQKSSDNDFIKNTNKMLTAVIKTAAPTSVSPSKEPQTHQRDYKVLDSINHLDNVLVPSKLNTNKDGYKETVYNKNKKSMFDKLMERDIYGDMLLT